MKIRIATRKSKLALWQARHVSQKLELLDTVSGVELVPLSTRGDEILDKSLQKIGGKGLFIKELEVAMRSGYADIAVHSMKDVPTEIQAGFCIAAMLKRADPSDAFVSNGVTLSGLAAGATIGSSSLRRQAQLRALRPDIDVLPLRGNVDTRLAKLDKGEFDAIILATAGLERLGLAERITEKFSPSQMLPATAQGVIGIECLANRDDLLPVLAELQDQSSALTTVAERAIAETLNANCQSPVACFATMSKGRMTVRALVATPDGRTLLRESAEGEAADALTLGRAVAQQLLDAGAAGLLAELSA